MANPVSQAAQLLEAEWMRLRDEMETLQHRIEELQDAQVKVREELSRVGGALQELRRPAQALPDRPTEVVDLHDLAQGSGLTGAILALLEVWSGYHEAKSVREIVQELMEADDRPWTSAEVLRMLEQRPRLTSARNLPAAVRTALWQLRRDGVIIALADGRNVASKWPGYVASRMPDDPADQTPAVRAPANSGRVLLTRTTGPIAAAADRGTPRPRLSNASGDP